MEPYSFENKNTSNHQNIDISFETLSIQLCTENIWFLTSLWKVGICTGLLDYAKTQSAQSLFAYPTFASQRLDVIRGYLYSADHFEYP